MKNVNECGQSLEFRQLILVLDFGGQYSQIIARKIRDLGVYCEIVPHDCDFDKIKSKNLVGIILSGGPSSVNERQALKMDLQIFNLNVPILGICYGAQLIANSFAGKVVAEKAGEYGQTKTKFDLTSRLFKGISRVSNTWMSHFDSIVKLPLGFRVIAESENTKIAAMQKGDEIFAVQFHPEVSHTEFGIQILSNFLFEICKCKRNWNVSDLVDGLVSSIKNKVQNHQVLLALSGGVDSCVLAALLSKAIGTRLTAVLVDNGFMRKNEIEQIRNVFSDWDMNFVVVDAQNQFLEQLKGVILPEQKRKIVGEQFIRVFENEARKIGKVKFFAQGTIYSDVVESGFKKNASLIKSHHNVGGLPAHVNFDEILEPLKMFFKDEVRKIGHALNLPVGIINRQPFPGPGLAIRVLGKVTKFKLDILREADAIFRQEIDASGLNDKVSQYFAVLSTTKAVGVKGDARAYDYVVILRAVESIDFMTADFAKVPYEVLECVSRRIVNEVSGVGRVVYDITTKPPATIEFE